MTILAENYVAAANQLLEHSKLMPIPYVANGHSLTGMDCQGLCEYLLTNSGVPYNECNLAGSNAHYRACEWTGTPEECKATFGCVPAGAWLFILSFDGNEPAKYQKDGVGNAKHMGVYLGGGVALHASASKGQVVQSAFNGQTIPNGGWNRVGLPRWIDYRLMKGGISVTEKAIYDAKVVTANGRHLNFRKAPRTGGTDIGDIPCGEMLQVFEEVDSSWARVYWNGQFGYVQRQFLQPIAAESVSGAAEDEQISLTLPRTMAENLFAHLNEALARG